MGYAGRGGETEQVFGLGYSDPGTTGHRRWLITKSFCNE